MKRSLLTMAVAALFCTMATMSMAANAVVYTETVPGEDGPMIVEVVVQKGVFSSLKVLGPDERKSLEGETAKESMNDRVTATNQETLAVDPLSGALDPSDTLIKAIHDGIAAAKVNDRGEKMVFKAGTWHQSLDEADRDIRKETAAELTRGETPEHAGYRVDPLSGSIEVPDDIVKLVARALTKAGRVQKTE